MNSPSLVVDGVEYFSAADVARLAGVSRQTLWRWRQDGKVPAGHKFRDRLVVFTGAESESIREYAFRLEPIEREALGGSTSERLSGAREANHGGD